MADEKCNKVILFVNQLMVNILKLENGRHATRSMVSLKYINVDDKPAFNLCKLDVIENCLHKVERAV